MLSENRRKRVTQRIIELVSEMAEQQFTTPDDIPFDENRITVGQYPSLLDFSTYPGPNPSKALIRNVEEANGSSFMGLWFMSATVPLLNQISIEAERIVYTNDPSTKEQQVTDFVSDIEASLHGLHHQLEVARELPKFFQGGTEEGTTSDIKECPQYTMGWYPLVDRVRIPAVIPSIVEDLMDFLRHITQKNLEYGMSNLTDGDIWSWYISSNASVPGMFEAFGEDVLYDPSIYKPFLSTFLDAHFPRDDMGSWLNEQSVELWNAVSPLVKSSKFPVETFYNPNLPPTGAFSCAVMSNILAAIPALDVVPQEDIEDITAACLFIREATKQALQENITWQVYAYDYYTIPTAPVGYLTRAHRMIIEHKENNGHDHFPDLLDHEALEMIAQYTAYQAETILSKDTSSILAGNDASPEAVQGNLDYATLVYCFSTMMSIWSVDPELYKQFFKPDHIEWDRTLVALTAELLLTSNEAANRTPGTGPYKLFSVLGKDIYVTMSSICFIVPPMLEAFALYLLSEAAPEE